MTEETKRCSRCKEELPLSAFALRSEQRTLQGGILHSAGPEPWCRECRNAYARERAAKRRQQSKPAWAQWRPRRAQTSINPQT